MNRMTSQTGERYKRQHLYTEWPNGHGGVFIVAYLTIYRRPGRGGIATKIEIEAYDSSSTGGQIGYYTPNEHSVGAFIREIERTTDPKVRNVLGTVQLPEGFRDRLKEALTKVLDRNRPSDSKDPKDALS